MILPLERATKKPVSRDKMEILDLLEKKRLDVFQKYYTFVK